MHNIHNYDNSKFKSKSLMFNYYVLKKKVLNVFNQLSIWLSFQLSIIFLIGIPVSLSLWSIKKRNKAVYKLLSIYWKISLLFFISLLLLIGKYDYALTITNISTLLMTISVWFWNDINDELKEYNFSAILFSNCSFEGCSFIPNPPNVLPL